MNTLLQMAAGALCALIGLVVAMLYRRLTDNEKSSESGGRTPTNSQNENR